MISICIKDTNPNIQNFLMNKIKLSNIPNIYYSKHNFKIYKNVIVHYLGNNTYDFYNFISNIISDTIINFYEPKIVKRLICNDYFYFDTQDKQTIFEEYNLLLEKNTDRKIFPEIHKYIKENKYIILEGFVNFRLSNYVKTLNELLENAVSKFVMDKEYLEFVSLLKLYIDSKIPEPISLNLIYVNNEATLLDEKGNIVNVQTFDNDYVSDISFSKNDYVLNTLISNLPKEIHLHLISPKDEFINTLELIFGERLTICSGCEICSAYKLLNLK